MSRTVIGLVVGGVAVIAAALGIAWHSMQSEKEAIGGQPAKQQLADQPQGATAPPPQQAAAEPPKQDPQTAATAAIMVPTFDIVRVTPDGRAVIAGRAAAKSKIVLLDGGKETPHTTTADDRGEWVLTVENPPFAPGPHELRIVQHVEGRAPVTSEQSVVIVVPQPTEKEKQALVMIDPPRGAPTLVQPPSRAGVPRSGDLAISTLTYDDRGVVTVTGEATAGMAVRIYIDNKPQGEVAADKDKRWRIVATDPVGLGKHVLRVERLARDGKVEQRLEESFERIFNTASGGGRLNIVVGDNLWNIARAHYGEGWRYTVIFEANKAQIKDPNLIYPGQVFALPKSN